MFYILVIGLRYVAIRELFAYEGASQIVSNMFRYLIPTDGSGMRWDVFEERYHTSVWMFYNGMGESFHSMPLHGMGSNWNG